MVSRRSILRTIPLAAAALAVAPSGPAAARTVGSVRVPPDPAAIGPAAAAVRGFTADLYRSIAAGSAGNVVCAPYSVLHALAMTRAGAAGTTAAEMDAVLHAPQPAPGALDAGLNAIDQLLFAEYANGDGTNVPKLTTANALWTDRELTVHDAFQDTLAGHYGAGAYPVDFRHAADAARVEINDWVSGRTNARIDELLKPGVVSADTSLILTNATYLAAGWQWPFIRNATAPEPFTRDDGTVVDVPMMRGPFDPMGYAEGPGWRAVDIPYKGSDLGMLVVMATGGPLSAVEAQIDGAWLQNALQHRGWVPVSLKLPKWSFRLPAELGAALSGLGMPTVFSDYADLSGITADTRLKIDKVVHETFIAVDEKGTEAAAATGVIIRPPSIPQGPQFHANRPFLYIIHERTAGVPLFIGRVLDPLA